MAALPATADPVVFLDVDVAPAPDLVDRLASTATSAEAVAAVARIAPDPGEGDGPYARYLRSSHRGAPATTGAVPWRHFLTTAAAAR